jgi:UDP-2,3-diacylglucosamine pyrophosphatase LpxH/glycosyltransferase involved in cell wall biosynthesis
MKIDIVTDTFVPDINGVAMTLGRLRDGLLQKGHDVHVIHTGYEEREGETKVAAFSLPGYREVRIGFPEPFKMKNRWLVRKPDVVYIATESPLGKSALKAAKSLGIPVATGFHTNFHQYMQQYYLGGLRHVAIKYLKNFHNRADCTLAPSPELVENLQSEGFKEVYLLGRGVDTVLFNPKKRCDQLRESWGANQRSPVLMIVGRLAPEKNLELGMRSFQRVREMIPAAQCIVVGDGPILGKLAVNYPEVYFVGSKINEELARYYASADVLLFPSETETFGNVLLEGMASQLITVSYDYAASASYIHQGENGFKAAKGDAESFMNLAVHAATIFENRMIRDLARRKVEQSSWLKIVEEFEQRLINISKIKYYRKNMLEKRPKLECRTVFLSDIHLGTPSSKAKEVVDFLKHLTCEKLLLNGDIIDGWALKRGSQWLGRHSRVIRKILKMMERDNTEVIYLRGNHDDILERFLPLSFGMMKIGKEHIHVRTNGQRYLVVHGDGFDSVSTNHKWLASVGAVAYDFLLKVNRVYNLWRSWRGLEFYSISKKIKAKVKSAVSFVDRYEELLQELAQHKKCDGIICGHIHTPQDKMVGSIHYLNSGDWVESLTAIIEHHDGRMELVEYNQFLHELYHSENGKALLLS